MQTLQAKSSLIKHSCVSYLLALFYLMLPFEYFVSTQSGTGLRYYAIIIVIAIIISLFRNNKPIRIDGFLVLLIFWLFLGTISYFWALSSVDWALRYPTFFLNIAFLGLVYIYKITNNEYRMIINSFLISATAMAIYTIFVASQTVVDPYEGRVFVLAYGQKIDPNYMVAIMIVPIGYSLNNYFHNDFTKLKRIINLTVWSLMVFACLLTGSRGGLYAIITLVSLILIHKLKGIRHILSFLAIVLLILIIFPMIIMYLPEGVINRYSFESLIGRTNMGDNRFLFWIASIEAIKNRWLLGYGVGNTYAANSLYLGSLVGSHNLYLAALVELGILGFSFLIGIFKFVLKRLKARNYNLELYSMVAMLVCFIFLDALTAKFFWGTLMLFALRMRTYDYYCKVCHETV